MHTIFALMFVLFLSPSWAHEALETSSFQEVKEKLDELRAKYRAREVLLVLDIDNTLLRARQHLGSDQWFEWQSEAISKGLPEANFKSFEELLKTQSNIYQLQSMTITETSLPQFIKSFKQAGHEMFLLTSRSPNLRNVTERDLKLNGLWFGEASPLSGIPNEFQEAPFKQPVSFMNGIFMTAGHHKGEALDYLVRKIRRNYKAIVFVDDLERHTKRVFEVFSAKTSPEIYTFRFSHEDPRVRAFREGSKTQVVNQALELNRLVNRLFSNRK